MKAIHARQKTQTHSIALLATGDEIITGDILNTNSQQIALRLADQSMSVGMHLATSDIISDIEQAIRFLLKNHQALIITGGLGPTSDDLTRYALSQYLNKPLVFDDATWEEICQRLQRFGYTNPPESNRQQALFPQGATIIPNPNGTAAGCYIQHAQQLIFMLPGPPTECLPMIAPVVIPQLLQSHYQQPLYREKWLLFRASEGKVAEELDLAAKQFDCTTGYRICYPYLEFKLLAKNRDHLTALLPEIEKILSPYLVGNGKQTASEQVKAHIQAQKTTVGICDHATSGLLENTLKNPFTTSHLHFSNHADDLKSHAITLIIEGLDDYWQNKKEIFFTTLRIELKAKQNVKTLETTLPLRGDSVKLYAVEWICQQLLDIL